MARDGSGTYTLPEAAFVFGTVISETAVNSDLSDIATALTGSIAKNGVTPITANLPMATYRHTGVGDGAALTDYAAINQISSGELVYGGIATGTADALLLTIPIAITAYTTGMRILFKASSSPNTGATTVNINSVAVKAIQLNDTALAANDILANDWFELLYDGTLFQMTQLSKPAGIGLGLAIALGG